MIQRELNMVQVEGELSGERIDMSIDKAAEHLIMERLIRLYSDTVLAFVREISTNAFDAHVAAFEGDDEAVADILSGNADMPVKITLPTPLAPIFTVRDQGIGMSYDDIVNVYSKYGASTKRNSNDYNGALGFGCKAPLAYTPTFTVQSVKNGHRVTVQVGRTPKGGGTMTVVEGGPSNPCPTTEDSGTTVMVPVATDDIPRVEKTVREFFAYWKPGTVLVNDEKPEHVSTVMRLNDQFAVIQDHQDMILMANVVYPTNALNVGLRSGYSVLAEVPTGDVEFTPSREGLENTPYTRARLEQVEADFLAACEGAIQKQINKATTAAEAVKTMTYWRSALPAKARSKDDRYVWQRKVLPAKWEDKRTPGSEWPFLKVPLRAYGVESRHDAKDYIEAAEFSSALFVTGFGSVKFTANHKRRLAMWRYDKHADAADVEQYIVIRGDTIPREVRVWLDRSRIVHWPDVKANYKLPVSQGGGGYSLGSRKLIMGSYDDVWTESGHVGETPADDIRADKPLYYFTTQDAHGATALPMAGVLHSEYTVVKLPMNRVEKFKRDFPAAKPLVDAAQAAYAAWRPTVTQDMVDALATQNSLRYGGSGLLRSMDPARLDDPKLQQAVRLMTMDLTKFVARRNVFCQILGHKVYQNLPTGTAFEDPMDDYPLINYNTRMTGEQAEHVYLYLNAVYAATTTP